MADSPEIRPVRPGDHVFLVDGSSYIFRAFHALPPLTRPSDGLPVGAVAGFCNMLWRLLRDADAAGAGVRPTHVAVVFDKSEKTFRTELAPSYKAHRPEAPEALVPQFGLIRDAVRAFNTACVEQDRFEADDLIATYTRLARAAGADVTIVASDKDLMQLVGPGVVMLDTMKNKRIAEAEVIERFGVPPEKVIDVQALCGDPVDNVPGVPGIGVKTAAQLILDYGSLEALLDRAGEIKQPKRRESLLANLDAARLSKVLVTLDQNVPLETPIEALGVRPVLGERLIAFAKAMEFSTLIRRVAEATGVAAEGVAPETVAIRGWHGRAHAFPGGERQPAPGTADAGAAAASGSPLSTPLLPPAEAGDPTATSPMGGSGEPAPPADMTGLFPSPAQNGRGPAGASMFRPAERVAAAAQSAAGLPFDPAAYRTLDTAEALDAILREAEAAGRLALAVTGTSPDPMRGELCGVALAVLPGRAAYLPIGHREGSGDLLSSGPAGLGLRPGQVAPAAALARLKTVLEDPAILKIGHDIKRVFLAFARETIRVAPIDDTMLLAYALDSGLVGTGLDELAQRWLGHRPIPYAEVVGTGKARVPFAHVELPRATAYAAEDADVTLRLWSVLKPRLAAERMTTVYETLERPMVPVLAGMERAGVRVDRQVLSRMSGDFAQTLAGLEDEINKLAGEPFNIGSPKQLGDILFGKFGLPGGKKTKTGAWSTGADVLEELAGQGHDLPARILDWRQLAKLKSTYTDALPGYINPETGRVHTSYALASTTTGRLSSYEPNLQNIPVRTEAGRKIRTAFVASPGMRLVSADYSQIELRVLAHIADIPQLTRAFADGLDIHAMTASEMFGVPIAGMDPMVRRRAKAINFGIIYGISAFGLAAQLGIGRQEAKDYIDRYFERFPGIRGYMEDTKAFCREHGYVETIFGRRAQYPLIASRNPAERAFNERAAINAPIQGSAADIIRRAMIRMPEALAVARLGARMLLQVHDELIFETPEEEAEAAMPVIRRVMEEAPEPAVRLAVPLQVDARAAADWEAAH